MSLISASGRLFALNGALKRCRYLAKITAALPLVAGGRKKQRRYRQRKSSGAVPSSAKTMVRQK